MSVTSKYHCRRDRKGCGKEFVARKGDDSLDKVTCPSCGANWLRTFKLADGQRVPVIERIHAGWEIHPERKPPDPVPYIPPPPAPPEPEPVVPSAESKLKGKLRKPRPTTRKKTRKKSRV